MELKDIIYSRRSIRKFKPVPLPREVIEDLIATAVQAPSASNSQPWRFLVVTDRTVIDKMYHAVVEEEKRIRLELPEAAQASFAEYGRYFVRFVDAPAVVVPIYKPTQILSGYLRSSTQQWPDIDYMELQSAVVSVSLAVQNLLLYAHRQNLGASCMTGPLIAANSLNQILAVPSRCQIAVLIPIGYPDEQPIARERKPADKVIKWI